MNNITQFIKELDLKNHKSFAVMAGIAWTGFVFQLGIDVNIVTHLLLTGKP